MMRQSETSKPKLHPPVVLDPTVRHLLTAATSLLVLAGFGWLVAYFYDMTSLLGVVLIVTYILLGPVNLMERGLEKWSAFNARLPVYGALIRQSPEANPRIVAVLLAFSVFFITLTVGTVQFLPVLTSQVGDMGRKLGSQLMDASDNAIDWADKNIGQGTVRSLFAKDIRQAEVQGVLKTHTPQGHPVTPDEKKVIQKTVIQNTLAQAERALASIVPSAISLVGGTVNGFVYFLAGLLLTYYFLIDGQRVKQRVLLVLPYSVRETAAYLLASFHQVMFAFVKGQVLLGLLTGFYMFLIYSFFHVPYAFLLGSLFALAELLPVVGTWIGITIGLTVILLNMEPQVALWVWLCSYAYQTIKDNILAPKVVGDVMGLHPMVIILSLLICAKMAGLLGVLMALPLASAVNVILRLLLQKDALQKTVPNAAPAGDAHA